MSFFKYFFGLDDYCSEEVAVKCPFPHFTREGKVYYESHASAHVNLDKKTFHCKVCDQGFNETTFISKIFETTYGTATRISKVFNNTETKATWESDAPALTAEDMELIRSLGISDTVRDELCIRSSRPGTISFPVFLMNKLIDIRTYSPNPDEGMPKVLSRQGAIRGELIPYDLIVETPLQRTLLICAGEKDMATTRSHGFNAATLGGGEMCLPFSKTIFKGRDIVILYDNDDAGKMGAQKLASDLMDVAHTVKICTAFHEICKEHGEDMTDFWNKYNGTREQLIAYMEATPVFTKEDAVQAVKIPTVTLSEATSPQYINKLVKSNIQVVAVSDTQLLVPTSLMGEKTKRADAQGQVMYEGEVREWEMTDDNVSQLMHLMDNNFKEAEIEKNIKAILHIPDKEKYIRITKREKEIVYKGYVTDLFESMHVDNMPMEYSCYSVGTRLESGKRYTVTHKIIPHPYRGQQLIMVIMDASPAMDSISTFKVDPQVIEHLKLFQNITGTVREKMAVFVNKVKGLLGYNGNNQLIEILDLSFHTVLGFNFGMFQNVRGYLDTMIVGESRTGKSSTAEALRNTYQLGTFTSLAGNSATIPGLIGGSNKLSSGGMQTKAGLIPQNHKGLVIFEEFGKCDRNITKELTDIRSSNEVRITRVSGTLNLPAMVRMISLTNVKTFNGEIKSIASYPNGISIITELVETAEDIARYDLLCVLSDRGNNQIDPFWKPEEPMPTDAYQTRIRWVWSRTADQIIITETVGKFIVEVANDLNRLYDCHIKIFGTEAWKKLTRLAIAVAGYTVSTDESYQNIIVTEEHVTYAAELFISLYDNPVFRLKEYVANERKYNVLDDEGLALLQDLFIKVPALLLTLEQEARPSRNTLMAAAGMEVKDYNIQIGNLVRGSFIKLNGNDVLPTERFRLGMAKINRNTRVQKVGETSVQI